MSYYGPAFFVPTDTLMDEPKVRRIIITAPDEGEPNLFAPVHCPSCGSGPGRQDPLYIEGAATGEFRCTACNVLWRYDPKNR